jgi:hypothetical protein
MQEETVYSEFDHFMAHYFPPMPTDDVFDRVLLGLKEDDVLLSRSRSKRNSDAQEVGQYVLRSFHEPPARMKSRKPSLNENKIFAKLEELGTSFRKHVNNTGANKFQLCVIPTKHLDSSVTGCNFQMDACITDASNPKKDGKLHVTDVAVPFEFKIDDSPAICEGVSIREFATFCTISLDARRIGTSSYPPSSTS